jgi:hypothetical protein
MAKNDPLWKILGIPAPPVTKGYHDYGCVYRVTDGPQRESLRHAWQTATWSWNHWGKKVRKDIESAHAAGHWVPLDRLALALCSLAAWLDRPKG